MSSVTFSSLIPELLADQLAAGDDRDVFQHRFAPIAKARGLDRRHLEPAPQLIDDQSRQDIGIHIFSDDQQWPPRMRITASSSGTSACNPESFFSCSSR